MTTAVDPTVFDATDEMIADYPYAGVLLRGAEEAPDNVPDLDDEGADLLETAGRIIAALVRRERIRADRVAQADRVVFGERLARLELQVTHLQEGRQTDRLRSQREITQLREQVRDYQQSDTERVATLVAVRHRQLARELREAAAENRRFIAEYIRSNFVVVVRDYATEYFRRARVISLLWVLLGVLIGAAVGVAAAYGLLSSWDGSPAPTSTAGGFTGSSWAVDAWQFESLVTGGFMLIGAAIGGLIAAALSFFRRSGV